MTARSKELRLTGLEQLLNSMAMESINIPVREINVQINKLLMLLGKYAKAERCYILSFFENMTKMKITHYWSRKSFIPDIDKVIEVTNPYYTRINKNSLHVIPDIYKVDGYQSLSNNEKQDKKLKSSLLAPLFQNDLLIGYLGFSSATPLSIFPEELKSVFRIAAELIVNLYEKKKIYSQIGIAQSIVSKTSSKLAYFDSSGRMLFSNTAFIESFMCAGADSVSHNFYSIFSDIADSNDSKLTKKFNLALSGKDSQIEVWIKNCENLSLYEISLHPNSDNDDNITGVIFSARDITDRVQLEAGILKAIQQERKRIGILLHDDLGHDLLAADIRLKLLSDRIRDVAPDTAVELVEIEKSVKDMMNDVRRLSHGLIPFKNQGLDLREMLDAAAIMMYKYYGLQCSYTIHPDVDITSEAVINELFNIIIESSVNAVKHSECDCITIDLSPEKNLYVMKITDNGKGIQETKLRFPGAGLEIMRYRARSIGGLLEIRGSRNRGTTVKVSFNPERINI